MRIVSFLNRFRNTRTHSVHTTVTSLLRGTITLSCILSILLCGTPQTAFSAEKDLVVVVAADFPPFYYPDGDTWVGASFEVAETILTRLGYTIAEVKSYPIKRLVYCLEVGACDFAPNFSATPQRLKAAAFTSIPHIYEDHVLIVKADSPITFSGDLKELTQFRFGAMAGWTHGPEFDSADYVTKEYRTNVDEQIFSLLGGRFDIAVNNKEYFLHYAEKMGKLEEVKVLTPPIFSLPVTMGFSKTRPHAEAEAKEFDQALEEFIQTEEYREILQKHGFTPPQP